MREFRTHYDNLKVSRDAPMEVIQAAYRSLARKYHPDRAGSTPESEAIMKKINASYEVLSDPAKRAKHDDWIASQAGYGPRNPLNEANGRGDSDVQTDEGDGRYGRGRTRRQLTVGTVMIAVSYAVTALSLMRVPGFRLIGIGMLLAGLIYLFVRKR